MSEENNSAEEQSELDQLKATLASVVGQLDDLKNENAIKDQLLAQQEAELAKAKEESDKEPSTDAQHNPAIIRDTVDTRDTDVAEELIRVLRSIGNASDALDQREIETVDKPYSKEKMEELAFMEELVTIRMHDTTDKNAVPVPPVWNDGKAQYFIRGQEQTVKRKYVERLARAKFTTYEQVEGMDQSGNMYYRQIPHTALLYDFELVEDANPRGRDWLRGILREPQ